MTYMKAFGDEAEKSLNQEKPDYSKLLGSFKSGKTYRVKIPTNKAFGNYDSHSAYGSFYTTVCTGRDDLYCQASSYYYKEAKNESDEKKSEELKKKGYALKVKERALFGFFDLESGKEFIVDVSKKQGQTLSSAIKKYLKNADQFAFELSKSGSGTSTTVQLLPVMDDDDLTKQEKKHLSDLSGKAFDTELFGKVFTSRTKEEQIEDLEKFGFDLSVIRIKPNTVSQPDDNKETQKEETYNF